MMVSYIDVKIVIITVIVVAYSCDEGIAFLLQGLLLPSITYMWAFWAPRHEYAKLLTLTCSGKLHLCLSVYGCVCVCVCVCVLSLIHI